MLADGTRSVTAIRNTNPGMGYAFAISKASTNNNSSVTGFKPTLLVINTSN